MFTVPPKPWYAGNSQTFDVLEEMEEAWFGRPILLFDCTFKHSLSQPGNPAGHVTHSLVFYEAFDKINLTPDNPLSKAGCQMFYEAGPLPYKHPFLYVGYASDMLGRVPLMPCFLDGKSHPTIPYSMRALGASGARQRQFEHGCAE